MNTYTIVFYVITVLRMFLTMYMKSQSCQRFYYWVPWFILVFLLSILSLIPSLMRPVALSLTAPFLIFLLVLLDIKMVSQTCDKLYFIMRMTYGLVSFVHDIMLVFELTPLGRFVPMTQGVQSS